MSFEIVGPIRDAQTIAVSRSIRELARLRRRYGRGRWRKRKGYATVRLPDGFIGQTRVEDQAASGVSGMARKSTRKKRFVVCIRNTGYPAALELRKIYEALPDAASEAHGLIRVIDESGEDYL